MSDAEEHITADREARSRALARMTGRFSALKGAFGEKGVTQRTGELVAGKAKAASQEAVAVVKDSKGIIAATAGLLALWLLRKPIEDQARRWWPMLQSRLRKENDK